MKLCSRCKTNFVENFQSWCGPCRKEYNKKYHQKHRKEIRERHKKWGKENPEKIKVISKKCYERLKLIDPERLAINRIRSSKRDRLRHPERWRARDLVKTHVRRGKIVKPLHCQNCHDFTYVESHHYKGYAPEHALDVLWLCLKCHTIAENLKVKVN